MEMFQRQTGRRKKNAQSHTVEHQGLLTVKGPGNLARVLAVVNDRDGLARSGSSNSREDSEGKADEHCV